MAGNPIGMMGRARAAKAAMRTRATATAANVTQPGGWRSSANSAFNAMGMPVGSRGRRMIAGRRGSAGRRIRAGAGIGLGGALGMNAVLGPRPPSSATGGLRPGGSQLPY